MARGGGGAVHARLPHARHLAVDRGTGAIRDLHDALAGRIFVHAVTQLEISSTELRQVILGGGDTRYLVPDSVRDLLRQLKCYAPRQ